MSFAASDLGVSASCMETCGFSAIESIACGTPFLAADAMGFHEHLTPGVNARLWEPGKTAAFDKTLLKFVQEKQADCLWNRDSLSDSVNNAHLPDCTDRALECYRHRLPRSLLGQLVLLPIICICFLYNLVGERLFAPDFPAVLRTIFSVPIWIGMGVVLPVARTCQPVCSSRLSMWIILVASVITVGCILQGLLQSAITKLR